MKYAKSITELIGKTPLVELNNFKKENNITAIFLAKLEYFNPAGSVKDRVAAEIILDAEEKGLLKPDSVIIEPTSGNTGIGLAAIAASKGYKVILTMPETMSVERRNLLKAYGAEIILTNGVKGMQGAIDKAKELSNDIENSFIPGQFVNPANPKAHIKTPLLAKKEEQINQKAFSFFRFLNIHILSFPFGTKNRLRQNVLFLLYTI